MSEERESQARERLIAEAQAHFQTAIDDAAPENLAELEELVAQIRRVIDDAGRADAEILKEALNRAELYSTYVQYIQLLIASPNTNTPSGLERAVERLRAHAQHEPNRAMHEEAIRRAVDDYREHLLGQLEDQYVSGVRNEDNEFIQEGILGVWKPHYQSFRDIARDPVRGPNSDDARRAVEASVDDMVTRGWVSGERDEKITLLLDLYQKTWVIEHALNEPDPNFDDIKVKLEELRTLTVLQRTGVSETEVLYNRMDALYQRKYQEKENPREFAIRIQNKLLSGEQKEKFAQLMERIINILAITNRLRNQGVHLHNIDDRSKNYLRTQLNELNGRDDDLMGFSVSPLLDEQEQTRLVDLYAQAAMEAEILLGDYVGDIPAEYGKDVEVWLNSQYFREVQQVSALWDQLEAENRRIIEMDRERIERLLGVFQRAMADLAASGADDYSYSRRFVALDIQINRLQRMLEMIVAPPQRDPLRPIEEMDMPEEGMPQNNTESEWLRYYQLHNDPDFLRRRAKIMQDILENNDVGETWTQGNFNDVNEYKGLATAMQRFDRADVSEEVKNEIRQLGIYQERFRILRDCSFKPTHSLSMTADVRMLPDWEHLGVRTDLFDYFTFENGENRPSEEKYRHSEHVRALMYKLVEILYERRDRDFSSRLHRGLPFREDGTPVKGWFDFGNWRDTPENKEQLMARMKYELELMAPELNNADLDEVVFLTHRIGSTTGIRLELFGPLYAAGKTPVDKLGENSAIINECNMIAPEFYSAYKRVVYMQLAEILGIPVFEIENAEGEMETIDWFELMTRQPGIDSDRVGSIKDSYYASRALIEGTAPLRQPFEIPLVDMSDVEERYGVTIPHIMLRNTYYSFWDWFFNPDVRELRRDTQRTLKQWKNGKDAYNEWKQILLATPGGVNIEYDLKEHEYRVKDEKSLEELQKALVDWVDQIINKGLSSAKKNIVMQNWRDIAILTLFGIDRAFRVYALRDQTIGGARQLLQKILVLIDQAWTMKGVGYIEDDPDAPISPLTGQPEHHPDALVSPLTGEVVDVQNFLRHSLPDLSFFKISAVVGPNRGEEKFFQAHWERQSMGRVRPSRPGDIFERPAFKVRYEMMTNKYLTALWFEHFKESSRTAIYGRQAEKQQVDPDKQK